MSAKKVRRKPACQVCGKRSRVKRITVYGVYSPDKWREYRCASCRRFEY